MRKFMILVTALCLMIFAVFPAVTQDTNTIADIVTTSAAAEEDAEFTILLEAVSTSERLTEALSNPDAEYTVFAPTDEAFNTFLELAEISAEELLAVPEVVEAILLYHVVEGTVPAEAVAEMDGEEVPTLLGDFAPVTIEVTEDGDVLVIDGLDLAELGITDEDTDAMVIETDIEADNGLVHVIDNVLIPSDMMLAEHFAMQQEMMEEDMDEDMAEATAEADMDGMAEETTETDMEGDMAEETPEADMGEMDEETDDETLSNTIAGIVIEMSEADDAEFTVLLAAIEAADESILTTLSDPDAELTVFAPTDEAFGQLLIDMEIGVEDLLDDTELLNQVLQYHVIEGVVMAEDVAAMDGEEAATLLGEDATISISAGDDGVVLNDDINVVTTDIEADNGVIHVIDGVLIPSSDE